jgi:class 3 adenylate cyclase
MGDDSTALVYLNISRKAYEGTEDLPYTLNYIGKIYLRQKKFDEALKTHTEAYNYAQKLDVRFDMTQSLIGIAQTHLEKKDFNSAIANFKKSLESAIPLNANMEIKEAYQGLSTSYSQKKDFANAFKYQELLLTIKDTIYNINTDKKLGTLQFTFDLEKKESQINLLTKDKEIQEQELQRQKLVRNGFIGGFAVVLLFAGVFFMQRNRISKEKKRSDELLLNILPAEVAEELKAKGSAEAKSINSVTVLFTDFKGFTQLSEKLSAQELVGEINECFSAFDHIMQKYGIEKIKTIGDAYMAAGGLPVPNETHAVDVVKAAIAIQNFMIELKAKKEAAGQLFFEIRIGVHTGPVVAGIVGVKKYSYDIWGDTVNTASRMESSGEVGKVNISGSTYELVKDNFNCNYRGKVSAKGKGEIDMYFVEGVING